MRRSETRGATWLVLAGVLLATAACGDGPDAEPESRLPYVQAPLDTLGVAAARAELETPSRGALPPLQPEATVLDPAEPPNPRIPSAEQLRYTVYRNDAYDFQIAYPDTLLDPTVAIGGTRGQEFASADERVRALVYAVEDAGPEALVEQYQSVLDDPDSRVTYHVLEDDWFVLTGYLGEEKFYEKTVLRGGVLRTFRIHYDPAHEGYYDLVTATMSASFS